MTKFSVELSPKETVLCNSTYCNVSCGNGYCDGISNRKVIIKTFYSTINYKFIN